MDKIVAARMEKELTGGAAAPSGPQLLPHREAGLRMADPYPGLAESSDEPRHR